VLTVRPGIVLAAETRRCFERVLVATDGSERSAAAVETAVALAPEDRRELVFCSVAEPDGTSVSAAQAAIERALDRARARGAHAEGRVLTGSPGVVLPEAAQRGHADLIVLGAHGCAEAGRDALGSVAERIVRTAPLPVLMVRTTAADVAADGRDDARQLTTGPKTSPAGAFSVVAVPTKNVDGATAPLAPSCA
jgi:nucleotide-binding universal stress UspA family protein